MSAKSGETPEHRLNVRDVDGEPFGPIMDSLSTLPDDESLLLINSFDPVPLYDVLEERGFEYETTNPEPGIWHVEISHA